MTDACPVCGADPAETLLAVCDVLVVKALETMGKWLIRVGGRARMGEFAVSGLGLHQVHTRWQDTDDIVNRALRGAWDVVPVLLGKHGCCGVDDLHAATVLDEYVHDLVVTGTAHSTAELRYRFRSRLGLFVDDQELVGHGA